MVFCMPCFRVIFDVLNVTLPYSMCLLGDSIILIAAIESIVGSDVCDCCEVFTECGRCERILSVHHPGMTTAQHRVYLILGLDSKRSNTRHTVYTCVQVDHQGL